jgi:hypothetical protein
VNKKLVLIYGAMVLATTAFLIALTLSNVPFFLAALYLLPMSIAIAMIEWMGTGEVAAFFIIFTTVSLVSNLLVFLPVLFAPRFKTRIGQMLTQLVFVMIYIIIGLVVFRQTGSWTSV